MAFLCLYYYQTNSCLTVFLTKGKRVFHMLILSLVFLGNGYVSGRISYVQASTYCLWHTYYITVLVFVCPYVRTTLAHPCRTVQFGVFSTVWIGVSRLLAHLCKILWSVLSRAFAIYKYIARVYLWWCGGWSFSEIIPHVLASWFPINEFFIYFILSFIQ